jgi:hypothetical protein
MKRILASILAAALLPMTAVQAVSASSFYQTGTVGVDVSYPNCGDVIPKADFGIVGVTGGLVYSENPCLREQASKFKNLSLYINTGLRASDESAYFAAAKTDCNGDLTCAAYMYGYRAAQDALRYANAMGVGSDRWWLDVETENTWNTDTQLNRQSIQGAYDALASHGATLIGVYSTTYQWGEITGGWQTGWPSWGATTWTSAKQAAKYCKGHEFTGGPSLLMQFKNRRSSVSQDVAC